jgi:hypothetical protein
LGTITILCLALVGCGGGNSSDQATIAQGTAVVRCEQAASGPGASDWRRDATAVGRVGFFGEGRDFRTAQKARVADFPDLAQRGVSGPVLVTKTPVIVEGSRPLTMAVAPPDRARAGIAIALVRGGPFTEIRFIPCRDQPRTGWPGGWVLRNHDPVTVFIHDGNGRKSRLVVGRP